MVVRYAILAALRREPLHGYAIRRRIHEMLGLLWPVNQGQLYATLARLAREDWIAELTASPDGAERTARRYEIRPLGARRLAEWLARSAPVTHPGDELQAKLRIAADLGDATRLRRLVGRQREACAALATAWRSQIGDPAVDRGATGAAVPRASAHAAAIALLEADVAWLAALERDLAAEDGAAAAASP